MLIDFCIVGLGNPGSKYFNTRHNVGFHVIDKLAEFFNIEKFTIEDNFLAASAIYKNKNIVLMKPVTFMNASGNAVKQFSDLYEMPAEKFLIIYDDANIDFGTLRLRPGGSDGGHNGMSSVIYEMMTDQVPRLRIGIKNDIEMEKFKVESGIELADFVLSEFTEAESKNIEKIVSEASDAVLSFIDEGSVQAMNRYNKNILQKNRENNTNSH